MLNVMFYENIEMDYRVDKFFAVLGFALCSIITALLFNPVTANFYFSFGRYFIYLALAVFIIAITLTWIRSFKLKGAKNHIMASIKTLVMCGVFTVAFIILVVTHSGI
jgi:hypothetical protein